MKNAKSSQIAFSVPQTAGFLGVSERFIWTELQRGAIAYVKVGRLVGITTWV
jgi:hypothetical protein